MRNIKANRRTSSSSLVTPKNASTCFRNFRVCEPLKTPDILMSSSPDLFLEKVFSDSAAATAAAATCGRVCTSHRAVLKSERVSLFSTSSV